MNDPSPSSSPSPDERLDGLLQKWAREQQPAAEHVNSLYQRVRTSLGNVADSGLESPITSPIPQQAARSKLLLSVLAVAAGVLLCLSVWYQLSQNKPEALVQGAKSNNTREALIDFTKQKQLMAKLQAVYNEPLVWIAETGDALRVELDDSTDRAATYATQPWLLIRLAVERQETSTSAQAAFEKPLWQIDLAVRNEVTVRLSGQSNLNDQLQVWPCLTEDGLVMVDTQFDSLGPVKTKSNQTNLMRPGSRTRLSSLNDEYALWQYIEVVQANGSES